MELTLSGNRAAIFAHFSLEKILNSGTNVLLLLAPDRVTIGQLLVVIVAPLSSARIVANLAGNLEFIDNHLRGLINILDISVLAHLS